MIKKFEEYKINQDLLLNQKENEIRILENKIKEKTQFEMLEIKELENRILNLIDEKTIQLTTFISKETSKQSENFSYIKCCIEVTLFSLI